MVRARIFSLLITLCPFGTTHVASAAPLLFSDPEGKFHLQVDVLTDEILHFSVSRKAPVDPQITTSPMVHATKAIFIGPSELRTSANSLETAKLRVVIHYKDQCARVASADSSLTLATFCVKNLDAAEKTVSVSAPQYEELYGLGQYFDQGGQMNYSWKDRVFEPGPFGNLMRGFYGGATAITQIPMLYLLSPNKPSLGIFFDHIYRQRWDFRQQPWSMQTWGEEIRWYFLGQDNLTKIRQSFMNLTGLPPVPPKKAFGLWVSEFGFNSWKELDESLSSMREKGFPVEVAGMDLQWYGSKFADPENSRMGSLAWDEVNFPNPEQKIRALEQQGVELMLIEQPYVARNLPEHGILDGLGYLVRDCETCAATYLTYSDWWGRGGMIDWSNPEAGAYWHDWKRKPLMDSGVNLHWTDLGEPEMYHAWAWYHGFPELGLHQHGDVHNLYNFFWVQSIAEGYKRDGVKQRPLVLTRSGAGGIQRFGVAMWSGDIAANMNSMVAHLQNHTNMSMVGVDYYGSDVGGFYRASGDGRDHELYTRWFANSALFEVPVRAHVWSLDESASSLPSEMGDLESNLANIKLRYALLPYLYSLAHLASENAEPVFPPLFYHHSEDAKTHRITDQKMIGPYLIGGFVTDYDSVSRDIYVPQGLWYDFYSQTAFTSQGQTLKDAPLYRKGRLRLPLLAKAGAIIPMQDDIGPGSDLRIRVYGGSKAASEFMLYDDDGETTSYAEGEKATTKISQRPKPDGVEIEVAPTQGNFTGQKTRRTLVVEFIAANQTAQNVRMNGTTLSQCSGTGLSISGKTPCWRQEERKIVVYSDLHSIKEPRTFTFRMAPTAARTSVFLVCTQSQPTTGTSLFAVGNIPSLGAWQPAYAIPMIQSQDGTWTLLLDNLLPQTNIEWKCLQKNNINPSAILWSPGENQEIHTGESGYAGMSRIQF